MYPYYVGYIMKSPSHLGTSCISGDKAVNVVSFSVVRAYCSIMCVSCKLTNVNVGKEHCS